MSTWQAIPNGSLSIDGDDLEILINSDENGNNYVVISLSDVNDLLNKQAVQEPHQLN